LTVFQSDADVRGQLRFLERCALSSQQRAMDRERTELFRAANRSKRAGAHSAHVGDAEDDGERIQQKAKDVGLPIVCHFHV
jgi:hypothetical protein